jgi:hypothetical protein
MGDDQKKEYAVLFSNVSRWTGTNVCGKDALTRIIGRPAQ